jgi:hypothetical protein
MSDAHGKLTQAEKDQIRDWVLKWKMAPCPVCGKRDWVVGDHVVQPVTIGAGKTLQLGGEGYPQVMLISTECGYTLFLNAVIVGIVKNSPSQLMVEK